MTEEKKLGENEFELSTGVILRGKSIPPGVFINLQADDMPPQMPKIKDKDGTVFTNPDDPAYIDQMKFWNQKQNKTMLNAMIILGTEVVSVPKGIPKMESDGWIEEMEVLGVKTKPENTSWRRLWWMLTFAALTASDWEMISQTVGRLSGVPEGDVDKASKFPGD